MSNELELQKQIEAVLFYKGEPMKRNALAKLLETTEEKIEEAVESLKTSLENRGITVVVDREYVALGTTPDVKELIETMRREDLEGPLGKAGLETLAIVLYQGPVTRADIEYIRGVNSSSILRSLTMRGLIQKKENPRDKRGYIYQTTPELPASLGLNTLQDMPRYAEMRDDIDHVLAVKEEESSEKIEDV